MPLLFLISSTIFVNSRFGVIGKRIGWHSFRQSLATNLRALGVDIKVAQELMRHSSCRTTLDVYTRAVDQQKREASLKVVALMPPLDVEKFPHPSAPSGEPPKKWQCRKFKSRKELLVDLIGIEPMTSSMPSPILLTAQWLEVGGAG